MSAVLVTKNIVYLHYTYLYLNYVVMYHFYDFVFYNIYLLLLWKPKFSSYSQILNISTTKVYKNNGINWKIENSCSPPNKGLGLVSLSTNYIDNNNVVCSFLGLNEFLKTSLLIHGLWLKELNTFSSIF